MTIRSQRTVQPGRTYTRRGQATGHRRVIAIGPEHLPPNGSQQPSRCDGVGVLFVMDNGKQGRASLTAFTRWAGLHGLPAEN